MLARKLEATTRESERLRGEVEELCHKLAFLEASGLFKECERQDPMPGDTSASGLVCVGKAHGQERCDETATSIADMRPISMQPTLAEELERLIDDRGTESGSELGSFCSEDVGLGLEKTSASATPPSTRVETNLANENPLSLQSTSSSSNTERDPRSDHSVQVSPGRASAGITRPSCPPAQQACSRGGNAYAVPRYIIASHDPDRATTTSANSADLNSLHGHADQGTLLTIAAVVDKRVKGNRRTDQYLLTDEGRYGRTSVRAILSRSRHWNFPRARPGDGVILRHVTARYSKRKIPYIRSVEGSAWCIWRADSEPKCKKKDCCKSHPDRRRMQELSAWWSE